MKKFEYLEIYKGAHEFLPSGIKIGFLNSYGEKGWELVAVITRNFIKAPDLISNYRFIFKREILRTRKPERKE